MSWLARSLASSLMPDSDHRHHHSSDQEEDPKSRSAESPDRGRAEDEDEDSPGRRIKEDISELSKTLTRQFWGVASFLAPPPASPETAGGRRLDQADDADDPPAAIAGIRNDLAEIGGKFRSGISRLSGHKAVSEFSKIASTFLPLGPEEEMEEVEEEDGSGWKAGGCAVGVTEEVQAFVRNISMHPETWLDFPLLPEEEESDDFDMSDAQQEHALAVERLAPRLAALRIELCPSHMSEGCFWKIYFVLLHPRLNKHDAQLLSTPQIVEARAMLQSLQHRRVPEVERPAVAVARSYADDASAPTEVQVTAVKEACGPASRDIQDAGTFSVTHFETEKHPVQITEVKVVDKSVIEEEPSGKPHKDMDDALHVSVQKLDGDGDEWLEDDPTDAGTSGNTAIPIEDDEDVSFSDLEEDDDRIGSVGYKAVPRDHGSEVVVTPIRVQLNKSLENSAKDGKCANLQSEEPDDWPDADDF